jgi:SP family myo-inositol transporter-like MFS transporter 13
LDIKREAEMTNQLDKNSIIDAFSDATCRRALVVGSVLWITHELSGINTLMYYTATMVQMSGVYDKTMAVWISAGINVLYVAFTATGIYLVERIGRRILLIISIIGVILALIVIATGFIVTERTSATIPLVNGSSNQCSTRSSCNSCTKDPNCGFCFKEGSDIELACLPKNHNMEGLASTIGYCMNGTHGDYVWASDWCPSSYSYIVMIGMIVFLISFGPGLGAIAHIINAEIYPLQYRSSCIAFTTALNWFFNSIVSLTFLTLTQQLGKPASYFLYCGLTICGGLFLYFKMPETKGRSLEETQYLFSNNNHRKQTN